MGISREWCLYTGKEHYNGNEGEVASLNIFLSPKKPLEMSSFQQNNKPVSRKQ